MEIYLKDILVGKANGLEEANDKAFADLFYTGNKKYQELADNADKFIISGRKGTGKTILAKYYENEVNKKGILTKLITTREVVLKQFLEKGGEELEKKEIELFVEYVILTEFSKLVIENKRKFLSIKNIFKCIKIWNSLNKLEELVTKRHESANYILQGFSTRNEETSRCYGEISAEEVGVKGGINGESSATDIVEKIYQKGPYYQNIDDIRKQLFYLLKIMPVNIIFDDLDEYDDKINNNSNFTKFLIVFIEKAQQINVDFREKEIINCKTIILIRSDIIKVLNSSSSNLNKTMADCEVRLNWIKKTGSGKIHPLMDLIATKIKKSNEKLKNYTNEEIVKMFFPETVNGVPIMDHMLNCSFGRPRDIINMLNIIKNEFPEENRFKADLFKATQLEYSTKFIDELRNEMSSYFDSDEIEECFNIIRRIGKQTFYFSDVVDAIENAEARWKYFTNPKEFVDMAYEFGIIGNTWEKENKNLNSTKPKYNFAWKYREDGFDNPDYSKKFYVHLALRKKLLR